MGIRGPANTPEFISAQGSMADALKALFGALSAPRVPLPCLLCGSDCNRRPSDPFRGGQRSRAGWAKCCWLNSPEWVKNSYSGESEFVWVAGTTPCDIKAADRHSLLTGGIIEPLCCRRLLPPPGLIRTESHLHLL